MRFDLQLLLRQPKWKIVALVRNLDRVEESLGEIIKGNEVFFTNSYTHLLPSLHCFLSGYLPIHLLLSLPLSLAFSLRLYLSPYML